MNMVFFAHLHHDDFNFFFLSNFLELFFKIGFDFC